jgi:hypothetical protein
MTKWLKFSDELPGAEFFTKNNERAERQKPSTQDWQSLLERALGYKPSQWTGLSHSRDELVGILRQLEDGSDPHVDDRRNPIEERIERYQHSKQRTRDERDEQLEQVVDLGSFLFPQWHTYRGRTTRPLNPEHFADPGLH